MLMHVVFPLEPFNSAVRDGSAGQKIRSIMEAIKPEAIYFTEQDGHRGAVAIVHIDQASQIPALAEPWFLYFNAECKIRIAMTPEDLQKAGLDELGRKWS
jgi:hypothetical protein